MWKKEIKKNIKKNFNGREPWFSGYRRRLMFQRLWIRILAPETGWTLYFSHWFVVKIVLFVWKDRKNWKSGWGWSIFKKEKFQNGSATDDWANTEIWNFAGDLSGGITDDGVIEVIKWIQSLSRIVKSVWGTFQSCELVTQSKKNIMIISRYVASKQA